MIPNPRTRLFSEINQLEKEIATFHARQNISLTAAEITTFQGRRQDGVAFDAKGKQCVFLEFTRSMDSVSSSDKGNWAERKELEKNKMYTLNRYLINYLSAALELLIDQPDGWSTRLSQEDPTSRKTVLSLGN